MSGGYRDDDLAYGSYRGQGEGQENQEGERGLLGDTLGGFLGKKPAQRQSVSFSSVYDKLNELNALNCSLLLSRMLLRPTNRSSTDNNNNNNHKRHMVVNYNNSNKLHMINNSKLLTANSRNNSNNNRVMVNLLRVTANPPANKNLKVLPRVVAHSSSTRSLALYMTLAPTSRAKSQAQDQVKSTAIPAKPPIAPRDTTMATP